MMMPAFMRCLWACSGWVSRQTPLLVARDPFELVISTQGVSAALNEAEHALANLQVLDPGYMRA